MKRWPIIRHARWLYLKASFELWWVTIGRHYWLVSNAADDEYLRKVWRGEA